VKNYTDLSPYNFVANSPLIYVDINGEKIIIHYTNEAGENKEIEYTPGMGYAGDNTFVVSVINSLDESYGIGGDKLITKLVKSKTNVNIHKMDKPSSDNLNTPYFDVHKAIEGGELDVIWNDEGGMIEHDNDGQPTGVEGSPARLLFHELVHAKNFIKSKFWMIARLRTKSIKFDNQEERKTIKEVNKTFKNSLEKRTTHSGKGKKFDKPTNDQNYEDKNEIMGEPNFRQQTDTEKVESESQM